MRNITENEAEVHHVIAGSVTAWRGGLDQTAYSFLKDLDRESLIAVYAGLVGITAAIMDRSEFDLGELFTEMAKAKGIYEHG